MASFAYFSLFVKIESNVMLCLIYLQSEDLLLQNIVSARLFPWHKKECFRYNVIEVATHMGQISLTFIITSISFFHCRNRRLSKNSWWILGDGGFLSSRSRERKNESKDCN